VLLHHVWCVARVARHSRVLTGLCRGIQESRGTQFNLKHPPELNLQKTQIVVNGLTGCLVQACVLREGFMEIAHRHSASSSIAFGAVSGAALRSYCSPHPVSIVSERNRLLTAIVVCFPLARAHMPFTTHLGCWCALYPWYDLLVRRHLIALSLTSPMRQSWILVSPHWRLSQVSFIQPHIPSAAYGIRVYVARLWCSRLLRVSQNHRTVQ
jgi:hypothetical protein